MTFKTSGGVGTQTMHSAYSEFTFVWPCLILVIGQFP